MKNVKEYCFPASVKEAVAALSRGRAAIIAGGTQLAKTVPPEIERLVDLKQVGLEYIKADAKGLHIGAGATFSDLAESAVVRKWAGGIIADAAAKVSSQLIRNMGTAGGNVVRPFPYNHLPAVFLALGAKAAVAGKGGLKTFSFAELGVSPLFDSLGRTTLLVEILVPAETKTWSGAFDKFARGASMWESYALTAVALCIKKGACHKAGVAFAAAVPRAQRFPEAEKLLEGGIIDGAAAASAGKAAAESVTRFTSIQAGAEYKRKITPALISRAIMKAAGAKA